MSDSPIDLITAAVLHVGDQQIPVTDLRFEWSGARPVGVIVDEIQGFEFGSFEFTHTWTMSSHTTHRLAVKFAKAFRIRPHEIGLVCACHSAPFPAARDYRRRTKHRNRRRK